jgi:hypothetical protein
MESPKKKKVSARKRATKVPDAEIAAQRVKAYSDMEPHLCDVVRMGEIAAMLFDCPDQGLFVFAVGHLEEMLQQLKTRCYAVGFAP